MDRRYTGQPVVPPSEYVLPYSNNQTWIGEWKIAVTSSSHTGWEYSRRKRPKQTLSLSQTGNNTMMLQARRHPKRRSSPLLQYTHRQRIWLRTVATNTTNVVKRGSRKKKRRSTNFYYRWVENIQDDWNFKGFGITFVKSMLYRNAFGLVFRIPITLHMKTWERYPALPNLGSSIAIFVPQLCICLFINLSLRIEYLQIVFYYISHIIPSVCTALLLLLLRGLALAISALLYPFTRQPLLLANAIQHNHYDDRIDRSVNYANWWDVLLPNHQQTLHPRRRHPKSDERIDVTWSFRWSLDRRCEFRTTCSHFYAIPLATVIETMVPLLPLSDNKLTIYSTTTSIMKMMDWIPRHDAAVGGSFVGPAYHNTDGFLITANSLLSLSGIYFTKQPEIRNGWKNIASKLPSERSKMLQGHDLPVLSNIADRADIGRTLREHRLDYDLPLELDRGLKGNATSTVSTKIVPKLANAKITSN